MIIVNERNVNVIDCNGKYQGSVGYDKIGEYFFKGYKVRVHNPFINKKEFCEHLKRERENLLKLACH